MKSIIVVLYIRACRGSESLIRDSNLIAMFLEKQREKVDSNLFLKWFDSRLIRESKLHNFLFNEDLWIKKYSRIIDDSNLDSNQFLNWFTTHESEFFGSRQALLYTFSVFHSRVCIPMRERKSWTRDCNFPVPRRSRGAGIGCNPKFSFSFSLL